MKQKTLEMMEDRIFLLTWHFFCLIFIITPNEMVFPYFFFFFLGGGGGHLGNQIGKYSNFKELLEDHEFNSQFSHIFS